MTKCNMSHINDSILGVVYVNVNVCNNVSIRLFTI